MTLPCLPSKASGPEGEELILFQPEDHKRSDADLHHVLLLLGEVTTRSLNHEGCLYGKSMGSLGGRAFSAPLPLTVWTTPVALIEIQALLCPQAPAITPDVVIQERVELIGQPIANCGCKLMLKLSLLLPLLPPQQDNHLEVVEAGLLEGESDHPEEAGRRLLGDWHSQTEQCKLRKTKAGKAKKHFSLKTSNHCTNRPLTPAS